MDKPALYKDNNYIFPVDRFNVLVDLSGMNRFDYPPAPPLKIDRVSDALVSAFHGEMSSQSYGGAVQQVAVFSRIIGSAKHAEDSVEYNKEFYKKIFSFSNRNAPLFHLEIDRAEVVNHAGLTGNVAWRISLLDVVTEGDAIKTKKVWVFKSELTDFSWNGCGFFLYKPCSHALAGELFAKLKKDKIIK